MSYKLSLDNNTLTLTLSGAVDLSETSDIKTALNDEPKSGITKLVIDGSQIEYLDSSAVALIIFSKRVAEDHGMACELKPFSEEAFKVISMAGLAEVLNVRSVKPAPSNNDPEDEIDLDLDLDLAMDDESLIDNASVNQIQSDHDDSADQDNDLIIKPGEFE
tara:strand:+ start:5064 stop:5549 length:486 start_codon:yes stop_codon:yes gene_type:complete